MVFPRLTLHKGQEALSYRRSALVLSLLYTSHIFSAWVSQNMLQNTSLNPLIGLNLFVITKEAMYVVKGALARVSLM